MKIGNTEQDISVVSEPLLNVNQEIETQANIKQSSLNLWEFYYRSIYFLSF